MFLLGIYEERPQFDLYINYKSQKTGMSKLRSLQLKKLLKELEYIESEFEYRTELINEADLKFNQHIGNFLDENPTIKEVYQKKLDTRIQNAIDAKLSDIESSNLEEHEIENTENTLAKVTSPKVKKLYREIVKITHPDLINKKNLNEIYLSATKYYNLDDKIGIYKICSELNIDYEIDEEDEKEISLKINEIKSRLNFLESTFAWKWFQTDSEQEKNQIMIDFIKLRLVS